MFSLLCEGIIDKFYESISIFFILINLQIFIIYTYYSTLINNEMQAGSYEVEFSAIGGSAPGGDAWNLSSGIYYYTLNAGEFVQTRKMILLK